MIHKGAIVIKYKKGLYHRHVICDELRLQFEQSRRTSTDFTEILRRSGRSAKRKVEIEHEGESQAKKKDMPNSWYECRRYKQSSAQPCNSGNRSIIQKNKWGEAVVMIDVGRESNGYRMSRKRTSTERMVAHRRKWDPRAQVYPRGCLRPRGGGGECSRISRSRPSLSPSRPIFLSSSLSLALTRSRSRS